MGQLTEEELRAAFPSGPLFKYLSLAPTLKPPSWQERLSQLLDGKAYHPSPSQFNDPFDCLPSVAMAETREGLWAKRHIMADRFCEAMPNESRQYVESVVADIFLNKTLDEMRTLLELATKQSNESTGIFSLAGTIDNVLMWSHYASNHTGIAVRFDWRRQMRGGIAPLFKVVYQDQRPRVHNFFDESFHGEPEALIDALCRKAAFWDYEQEWRSIQPHNAGQIIEFDPAVIDGIVLGAKCSAADEGWIRERVIGLGLTIARVVPDRVTFDLRFAADGDDIGHLITKCAGFPFR